MVVAAADSWCDIHPLVPGSRIMIGRGGDCQIVLHSNRCSRRHCEIFSDDSDRCVRDLKNRNGTRLNGRSLKRVSPLNPGDRLEISGTVFLLTSSIRDIEGASLDSNIHDPDTTTAVENMLPTNGAGIDSRHDDRQHVEAAS
jgi:pSer/pThr/pTyr-binding forkhead associated (FHA) protein